MSSTDILVAALDQPTIVGRAAPPQGTAGLRYLALLRAALLRCANKEELDELWRRQLDAQRRIFPSMSMQVAAGITANNMRLALLSPRVGRPLW
jgi:hypothetical protein